jgi:surface antigen
MTGRTSAFLAFLALTMLPVPAPADPPPWAPAHGWRKKHDPNYVGYTGKKWEKDYGVVEGTCNTQEIGAVLGAVVGGAIGSQHGNDSNRPVAILVGGVLGAVIGAKIGRTIDDADRACIGHALELAGERTTVRWKSSAGLQYELTPMQNGASRSNPCREFVARVSNGRATEDVKGAACRRANGEGVFMS